MLRPFRDRNVSRLDGAEWSGVKWLYRFRLTRRSAPHFRENTDPLAFSSEMPTDVAEDPLL